MRDDAIFTRGFLTDNLLDHLEAQLRLKPYQLLVGDGIAPKEGGWSEGQPGEGKFVPYTVVSTGPASANQRSPLGVDNDSWRADYSFRAVGGSRQQADWVADRIREVAHDFPKDYGDPQWRVIRVQFTSLGAVSRNDQVDPPYWELSDSVSLWVERS